MSATAMRGESDIEATINAFIIYDRRDFAARVNAMIERVARRLDEPTHCSVKPWRVDMLKLPSTAETALAEAAEAHLIVLALSHVQSLASFLLDWLDRWARCRQVQEAAVALWNGESTGGTSTSASPEFSRFAQRHGLSLILEDNSPIQDTSPISASNLHEREVSLPPTLQHILEPPVRDYHKHWGINE